MTYAQALKENNIFVLADAHYNQYVIPTERKKRPPRTCPMPRIESNGLRGPIEGPDEEYEMQWELKKKAEKKAKFKTHQDQMIDLLANKDKYTNKLNALSPIKKNEKELAFLNFRLQEIDQQIKDLEELSGIRLDNLDEGSKIMKFYNLVKKTVKKTWKRFTKFVKKYKEPITACLFVAIPSLVRWVVRKLFGG